VAETRHEREGIVIRNLVRPVDRAGCYVPGGRAVYPSTVLMTAIPAQVAGVAEIALCVPPGPDGAVPAATLAAAALCGLDEVYRVGGAQAIAALAYGTASIAPVDVIVGPGNVYVTLAKREVAGVVGIESTAGPSELVVVADESAPPDYVAIDLMAQAEHGPHGAALLVTWSEQLAEAVEEALERLLATSARREDIEATLATGGRVVLVDGPEQAMAVANVVAPEHLELMNTDPVALVPLVRHAGAVFCGHFAPAAVGDYVAGVNHVLPTARTARFSSALRVGNFMKHVHVVGLDEAALARVAPYVASFAEVEGLEAHALSVRMRGART
jgi:histidinol dehydrogenase